MAIYRSVSGTKWGEPTNPDGTYSARLFTDFRVDDDGLSVWRGTPEVAARIVASGLEEIRAIHLLAIPEDLLSRLGLSVAPTPSSLPDPLSSTSHAVVDCHSGARLAELVEELSRTRPLETFDTDAVIDLLVESAQAGLDLARLKPRVLQQLSAQAPPIADDAAQALEEAIRRRPQDLTKMKLATVEKLVNRGAVAATVAAALHRGFGLSCGP